MRPRALVLGLALSHLCLNPLASSAQDATPFDSDSLFVTADWVAERIDDPHLVLLHVGSRQAYDAGHLPGARYISLSMIAEERDGLSLEMPAPAQLAAAFEELGVSDDSRVVIYFSGGWVTHTARVYLSLDYLGLGGRASILDGGMAAWTAADHPLTTELPQVRRGSITPRPREVLTDAVWLTANLENPNVAVVDARNHAFYTGRRGGHGQPRPGHVAGAGNLPFTRVVGEDDNRILGDEELERLFRAAGVEPGDTVVTYCHIGQQASLVYLAARRLGYDARLYDGSYQQWSNLTDLPVEWPAEDDLAQLITTERLADQLQAGNVSVLDLRSDLRDYLEGHIPGAQYVHFETLRATREGVPGDLLPAESYGALFSQLGISHEKPVVIYGWGGEANFNATFIAWLLVGFGHPSVRVLDGGYAKWAAEDRPTSRRFPEVTATEFPSDDFLPAMARRGWVTWVVENAGTERAADMVLVDVRPADQYRGEAGAQARRGHIPGAINHVWSSDLVTQGTVKVWKPLDELRASYEAQGITPDKHVIAYCNTGTEATHVYFTLRELLGYPLVDVYFPSWTDWSAQEDLPIVSMVQGESDR